MDGFAERLRTFRELRGWSQEYVGLELGVSKATVSKWETGRAQPSLEHLAAIRLLYAADGGTLDYLIAGVSGFPAANRTTDLPSRAALGPLDADEQAMLVRFRRLRNSQRRGLLSLLTE